LYLFLITCVPFTTIIVGRFPNLAPAICFYAGTTALIAAVAWRMMSLLPDIEPGAHIQARRFSLAALFATSLVAIGVSLVAPGLAMWALALNVITPLLWRWLHRTGEGVPAR
jgi:TMEM175 potassium channel family protein